MLVPGGGLTWLGRPLSHDGPRELSGWHRCMILDGGWRLTPRSGRDSWGRRPVRDWGGGRTDAEKRLHFGLGGRGSFPGTWGEG